MPQLRALRAFNANVLDAKGHPISCQKGDVIDVSDEVADDLMRHVHPEFGPAVKRAGSSPEADAVAQAARMDAADVAKPANRRQENAAR